jgi:hypothetical protein
MESNVPFWMSAIGIPILAFILNFFIRLINVFPRSFAADWALILIAFDFIVVGDPNNFAHHIIKPATSESLIGFMFCLIVLGLIIWANCVFKFEPAMDKALKSIKLISWGELALTFFILVMLGFDTWAHIRLFSFQKIS